MAKKFKNRVASYEEWEARLIRYAKIYVFAVKGRYYQWRAKDFVTSFLVKWASGERLSQLIPAKRKQLLDVIANYRVFW